jgi:hypothetical protein
LNYWNSGRSLQPRGLDRQTRISAKLKAHS